MAVDHRVLLKLSGEALKSDSDLFDFEKVNRAAGIIRKMHDMGTEIGIVISAGNIWRGRQGPAANMDAVTADQMGMLGTMINCLCMADALRKAGLDAVVQSAVDMNRFAEPFNAMAARRHLREGRVVLFACGTGNPFFSTDSGVALRAAQMGPATTIIDGLATGMYSAWIPVVTIVLGILCAYGFAGGFEQSPGAFARGLYGVGFAAVGMLSTLGITLATDAYGPIADNAGGNAEMSEMPSYVRERTDALDSLGNTTAATGKGFAIGSAALTAMALLASFIEECKIWMGKFNDGLGEGITAAQAAGMSILEFVDKLQLTIMNPLLIGGLFIGGMAAFLFCAMTMKAVGRAAGSMVEEVRRQFKEMPGIMEGKTKPDYARCVAISTAGAQREMLFPSLLAIIIPVATGLLLGVPGVMGLLAGGLTAGFVLATMLNNAGGAWDNAKKYIENGAFGGKKLADGSKNPTHGAAVIGDTVGDPCKDTSGPALNILIKLMSMVCIVFAPVFIKLSPMIQKLLGINGILQ